MSIEEHDSWPRHITEQELRDIIESDETKTLFDVSKEARVPRDDLKTLVNKMYNTPGDFLVGAIR